MHQLVSDLVPKPKPKFSEPVLLAAFDVRYVYIDTSPGLRLRVVCHSYKFHPHEWSVRCHLYKHITQRVSTRKLVFLGTRIRVLGLALVSI